MTFAVEKLGRRIGGAGAFIFGLFLALSACSADPDAAIEAPPDDAAAAGYAEVQERGMAAMGVDQYTSTHLFDALPDGGRIELQRDVDDPDGVATIRQHLQDIALAFEQGDFRIPGFVHDREVPGTQTMARSRDHIDYVYSDLPRGGEVRITTTDSAAVAAIHEFMEFQRMDHRAGGEAGMHGH